jgi:ketosteroid isomerase-like protein
MNSSHRTKTEESQVAASLARYRQLVVEVDAECLADMFVGNGELSHGNEPPHVGQADIRSFLKQFGGYKIQKYELQAATTTVDARTAKQHGNYKREVLAPNGSLLMTAGEFDAVWQHQPDGRWLLVRMHTVSTGTVDKK